MFPFFPDTDPVRVCAARATFPHILRRDLQLSSRRVQLPRAMYVVATTNDAAGIKCARVSPQYTRIMRIGTCIIDKQILYYIGLYIHITYSPVLAAIGADLYTNI